jgi:hypothetical protein
LEGQSGAVGADGSDTSAMSYRNCLNVTLSRQPLDKQARPDVEVVKRLATVRAYMNVFHMVLADAADSRSEGVLRHSLVHSEAPFPQGPMRTDRQLHYLTDHSSGLHRASEVAGVQRIDGAIPEQFRQLPRLTTTTLCQYRFVGLTLYQPESVPRALRMSHQPKR